MNKKVLFSLACVLTLFMGVRSASAYFTTYATADGNRGIQLGNSTHIEEQVEDLDKTISVVNHEDSLPVFVRVKVFAGSTYEVNVIENDGWKEGSEGFYYYNEIVEPGESTGNLKVRIQRSASEGGETPDDFNIVVVSESSPVIYDEAGNAIPSDWSVVESN